MTCERVESFCLVTSFTRRPCGDGYLCSRVATDSSRANISLGITIKNKHGLGKSIRIVGDWLGVKQVYLAGIEGKRSAQCLMQLFCGGEGTRRKLGQFGQVLTRLARAFSYC